MKTFSGWDSFSLESLEGRSLMSAAPLPVAAGPAPAVVVADASFLNAASDLSPTTGQDTASDADQYDFGGVWGSSNAGTQAAGMQVRAGIDLDGGAIDQDPGGGFRHATPSDLNSVATPTYVRPAEFKGDAPVIIDNTDPVMDDAPATSESDPQPVVQAPVVNAPAVTPPAAQPQAPQAISVSAPSGDAGFSWIEIGGKKKTDIVTADQIVIQSTFIAG